MKVMVVVNDAGEVIAAHVPVASERGPDSRPGEGPMTGFLPSEGQQVQDLELPEDDVPGEPPPDFLETLQRYKDQGSSEASG